MFLPRGTSSATSHGSSSPQTTPAPSRPTTGRSSGGRHCLTSDPFTNVSTEESVITSHLIRSFDDLTDRLDPCRPVITLFSGGLDSSYLLLRLRQMGFGNVHALSVDVGGTDTTHQNEHIAAQLGVRLHTRLRH